MERGSSGDILVLCVGLVLQRVMVVGEAGMVEVGCCLVL